MVGGGRRRGVGGRKEGMPWRRRSRGGVRLGRLLHGIEQLEIGEAGKRRIDWALGMGIATTYLYWPRVWSR